jgi:FkbM family methyltransferase
MKNINYKNLYQLGINTEIGVGNFFEMIIRVIYSSTLETGDIAIDGGANRGLHTFPMANIVGDNGLVIGFEAIPKLASDLSLRMTNSNLENVLIKSLAIGAKKGVIDFHYVVGNDYFSGINEQEGMSDNDKNTILKISVPLSTLDIEVDNTKKIKFIKLDLEGGEYDALLGAERIMVEDKPLILFENGREKSCVLYGYDRAAWFSLFESRQYEIYDLFGRNFSIENWGDDGVPWYFIAASSEADKEFIRKKLPNLIDSLFDVFIRFGIKKVSLN